MQHEALFFSAQSLEQILVSLALSSCLFPYQPQSFLFLFFPSLLSQLVLLKFSELAILHF